MSPPTSRSNNKRQQAAPCLTVNRIHGVISQNIELLIFKFCCKTLFHCVTNLSSSIFQPEGLTVIVEISNIVFSAIFAVEMVLKVIAEGPFSYVSNGFNVFDGVIVVLR
jgi:hypothetical protein